MFRIEVSVARQFTGKWAYCVQLNRLAKFLSKVDVAVIGRHLRSEDPFPELNNIDLHPYRKSVLIRHAESTIKCRLEFLRLSVVGVLFFVFLYLVHLMDEFGLGWLALFASTLLLALVIYFLEQYRIQLIRKVLAQYCFCKGIRPKGCLRCGYDLNGIESLHCPECGQALAPEKPRADIETGADSNATNLSRMSCNTKVLA
jgi:hypothetical protein